MDEITKVLYIAGSGRNGSTLIGNLLGQAPGFCSIGELRYIWDRGLVRNTYCGCGEPFRHCPFWADVLAAAGADVAAVSAGRMAELREAALRSRDLLLPGRAARKLRSTKVSGYLRATEALYRAIVAVSGCRVIVDSSKFPSYQRILEALPGIDLYTVHLVRDPRAVTYSWSYRRKAQSPVDPSRTMTRHNAFKAAVWWHEWNTVLRQVSRRHPSRYLRLRYEDFVQHPEASLQQIFAFAGEADPGSPAVNGSAATLGVHHTVSGNPDRFRTGPVQIRRDQEWETGMSGPMRLVIAALTWPELRRYDYPLLGGVDR